MKVKRSITVKRRMIFMPVLATLCIPRAPALDATRPKLNTRRDDVIASPGGFAAAGARGDATLWFLPGFVNSVACPQLTHRLRAYATRTEDAAPLAAERQLRRPTPLTLGSRAGRRGHRSAGGSPASNTWLRSGLLDQSTRQLEAQGRCRSRRRTARIPAVPE